ncbi:MAG: response regulator [Hungatella sp.]|nr:response regulator [Hungatella sp.]
MTGKSQDTISDIGMIYMSEMSRQLQEKFDAIIKLKLSEAEGVVKRTPPESAEYGSGMIEELALSGTIREFDYLALYTDTGEREVIYGGTVEISNEQEFRKVLKQKGGRVTSGFDESGRKLLLLFVDAKYPLRDGDSSSALVAGIPMEYLNNALVLEGEDSLVYSHIIRSDGSFVIRSGDGFREDYFTRMREVFEPFGGKTPEQYAAELEEAIAAGRDYSTMIMANGMRQHLYCSQLPDCQWKLLAIMPYGVLDDAIDNLGKQRQILILGVCSVILGAVIVVFMLYYRLSQNQMKALNEAEQAAVQANKAKSEFLSNMSHDIRTPMNGIVGMTAIAMVNINDSAKVKDCLTKITLSSKHLLGLINDVLDMSKIESGKLSLNKHQVSLRETMDSIVNIVQPQIRAKNQHFDIFIQNVDDEEVYCDSVRLNQVLINLLSNAIKFTPEGGTVNVFLSQEPSPAGKDWIRCNFWVKDNGIGMTPEFQKTIFDTFTRERNIQVDKTEGSGLGMAITKYIVDAMNGTIELDSSPGRGSQFHIVVDFEKAAVRQTDMILPNWNMLVVDNNEDLCQSAVFELKKIGIEAEWALDGKTAIKMAQKRHDENRGYQIILLDWKMPEMDGLETTREIRRRVGDEIPIFIISAYDWSDIEGEAKEAGIQGFISKPLFKSNLYLSLSKYMVEQPENEETGKEKERNGVDLTGKRILLAEDNDLNWEIAEELLSETGLELERVENGRICVETFEKSKEGYYDAILMDIRMPVMTGYEAAKAIRGLDRQDAGLPIIAMTADAFSDDIQRCLDCGMNEHVPKPIDVDLVLEILKKYLDR